MTSKERMLTALAKGKPDRLPVSVHQWQGYHLDVYLDGIDALDAFQRFGMDAQIQYFEDMGQFWLPDADYSKASTPEWRDEVETVRADPDARVAHHTIHTPEGTLTYKTAGDRKTTWITEYLIKRDEDVELIRKYMPVPKLDPQPVAEAYERLGDRGILRGFVWGDQAGCWQHGACLMDPQALIVRAAEEPDFVHGLLKALLEKKLRFIETMVGARFDLVETGGGSGASTVISPAMHAEFCEPYDRAIHDALHDAGFITTYHICGGSFDIEESIAANGTDAFETLAPVSIGGNQEPWDLKDKLGARVAYIGGIDQHNVLTAGSDEDIRAAVERLFASVGRDGGYICSCADHFFDTPPKKLDAFAKAAHGCRY